MARKTVRPVRPTGGSPAPGRTPPGAEDDPALVARCLAGDAQAWTRLVGRYEALVYSVPLRMGLDRPQADDVFQDTFVALLEHLPRLSRHDRLAPWLAVTARRKTLDRRTRGPARFESPLPDLAQTPSGCDLALDELLRLERQNEVRRALAALGPPCRELLESLFFNDPPLPYLEIARSLGLPVGSIGPRRQRCLDRLLAELGRIRGAPSVSKPSGRASRTADGRKDTRQ